jgi:hypothetical protein
MVDLQRYFLRARIGQPIIGDAGPEIAVEVNYCVFAVRRRLMQDSKPSD